MSYRACLPTALANTLPLGIFQRYQKEELIEYVATRLRRPAGSSVAERTADFMELVSEVAGLPSSPFLRDLLYSCTQDPYIQLQGGFFSSITAEKFIQRDKKFIPILEEFKSVGIIGEYMKMGALAGAVIGDHIDLAKHAAKESQLARHAGSTLLIFALVNRNRGMIELLLETGHKMSEYCTNSSIWRLEAMALLGGELLEYRYLVIDSESVE